MLLALCLVAACGRESNPLAEEAATRATVPLLEMLDARDYAAVRAAASPFFREQVGEREWETEAKAVRDPLGAHKSRAVGTTTYVTDPWGAPPGEYVIVSYDSHWERASIWENFSMQRQPNGAWALAGYHAQQQ